MGQVGGGEEQVRTWSGEGEAGGTSVRLLGSLGEGEAGAGGAGKGLRKSGEARGGRRQGSSGQGVTDVVLG